jgi:hypothetical protein
MGQEFQQDSSQSYSTHHVGLEAWDFIKPNTLSKNMAEESRLTTECLGNRVEAQAF